MRDESALIVRHAPPGPATAAVLTLHGGQEESRRTARPWQMAALRMHPVLRAAEATAPQDVLLGQIRYRYRGWNDGDPVDDALRALDELGELTRGAPVVLVGHSMGARAALRAAAHPTVRGVLGLAPWCPPGDPVEQLGDVRTVLLHGDRDRVTVCAESEDYVRRARAAGTPAGLVVVRNGDHAMIRRSGDWHRATAETVAQLLRPDPAARGLAAQACAADGAVQL
ncbi:alpha/beta fold hydrolase [Streptomyces sp. NPDC101152]|uniref:alpha/beta fold hydrolase n=1 Tax=Streptomyces sp. NPDC101152 TaxID=3366116 RepID=UPI00380BE1C5